MRMQPTAPLAEYLAGDDVVQVNEPAVRDLAGRPGAAAPTDVEFARAAFEWVRDRVTHCVDAGDRRVTVTAADILREGTGFCFAKAHLLVAVLRARGITAGFCYQRLADREGFVLHGLVAVRLDGAWHRLDPRCNRADVDAQFSLDVERLAFAVDVDAGEVDYPWVLARPAAEVVAALRGADDALVLAAHGLPAELVSR